MYIQVSAKFHCLFLISIEYKGNPYYVFAKFRDSFHCI
ncbi:hypothetical protein B4168_1378 [Anoxybacillus flavithermus]|nr:hypothetical protein B4168_1378 [Anoxybacillus flavithermus]